MPNPTPQNAWMQKEDSRASSLREEQENERKSKVYVYTFFRVRPSVHLSICTYVCRVKRKEKKNAPAHAKISREG